MGGNDAGCLLVLALVTRSNSASAAPKYDARQSCTTVTVGRLPEFNGERNRGKCDYFCPKIHHLGVETTQFARCIIRSRLLSFADRRALEATRNAPSVAKSDPGVPNPFAPYSISKYMF